MSIVSPIKRFAQVSGLVMLVMAFIALFAPGSAASLPMLEVNTSYGAFLGILPMNVLNKIALLAFGIAGVVAASAATETPAINYSRVVAIVMGALAVLGLFPQTNTLFGYWPLFGGEVLAHGVFAVLGAYFGYVVPSRERTTRVAHVH